MCYFIEKIFIISIFLHNIPSVKDIKIFNLKQFVMNNRKINFYDYLKKWKELYNSELLKKIWSDILFCLCVFGSILLMIFELIQKNI